MVAEHLETFLASLDTDPDAKGLPAYVQREFYDYLQCGILAHGFLRMAQTAAHLIERVIPWVPTRQWMVSVPIPLRYWMAASQELTAKIHTIIRTTISQYYVNQAVTGGIERQKVQPGAVMFIQRFGGAINLKVFVSDYTSSSE